MKTKLVLVALALVLFTGGITSCAGSPVNANTTQTTGVKTVIEFENSKTMPPILKDITKKYTATIDVEGKGKIVIDLFAKDVPIAVSNFIYLAQKGYYNGCTFHRVIADFMAQGGDPTGTGSGGPGYTFGLEITKHKHVTGAISMANTNRPNSNGGQFFICFKDLPFLDGGYTVFGQVTQGMDVVKKITLRDPQTNPKFPGDKITTITIDVK